jgi:hypothetical protein
MATLGKKIGIGMAAIVMLAAVTTGAQAIVPGGGIGSFGGTSRSAVQITGTVVCTECSRDEAREAQQHKGKLYQLTHLRGQLVLAVTRVNDSYRWATLAWPPRLWVRGKDSLFAQLTAEENLFKEVQITGLLGNSRTLDMFEVTVRG